MNYGSDVGNREKFAPLPHPQALSLSRVVADRLPLAVVVQAVSAVFDDLFAVLRQNGMGLDAFVRIEHRLAIAPSGRQLGLLVKLNCAVRQGFFS